MTDLEQLRQTVEQERERFGVAGLSVVVVKDREVLLAEGFGSRDLERDLPATPETLFAIASDSKAFTAALCATFVDEGKLEWDKPVRDVVPWFQLQDPHASELVSVRDLLSHRTGLPRHDAVWFWGGPTPPQEEIVRKLRHLQPSAPLRQLWQYNNNAYTTAGYLAGVLAGSDWETALRERVLDPVGMKRTTLGRIAAEATGDSAVPYDDRTGKNEPVALIGDGSVGPAGGIWSNAEEMSRWVLARLAVPQPDGRLLLSRNALRELHAPAMVKPSAGPMELPGMHSLGYALAADVVAYRGHKLVHHGGNLHGFCSNVYLAPDSGHAVVVLANANASGIRTALPLAILDQLLGLATEPWGERLLALTEAVKVGAREASAYRRETAAGRPPSRPLEDYAGTYTHPAYDVLEVRVDGDRLVPRWHELDELEMRHRDYDTWDLLLGSHYEDMPMPVVFRFGAEGVVGVEAALEPTVDPILFERQPAKLPAEQLERLTGSFAMGPLPLEVSVVDGVLKAEVAGGKPLTLHARDAANFSVEGSPSTRVEFVLDASGAVEQVVVHPVGVFRPGPAAAAG
ncbi:MAG: serine hydrolase [Actinobacteria bacterium]|nr:serine hydrolase [Actinomycetota bacterium]MCA1720958.1 serine hydrolase [Actinomycetota bacterium]